MRLITNDRISEQLMHAHDDLEFENVSPIVRSCGASSLNSTLCQPDYSTLHFLTSRTGILAKLLVPDD